MRGHTKQLPICTAEHQTPPQGCQKEPWWKGNTLRTGSHSSDKCCHVSASKAQGQPTTPGCVTPWTLPLCSGRSLSHSHYGTAIPSLEGLDSNVDGPAVALSQVLL